MHTDDAAIHIINEIRETAQLPEVRHTCGAPHLWCAALVVRRTCGVPHRQASFFSHTNEESLSYLSRYKSAIIGSLFMHR